MSFFFSFLFPFCLLSLSHPSCNKHTFFFFFLISLENIILDFSVAPKLWGRDCNDSEPRMVETLGCQGENCGPQKEVVFLP